MRLTDLEPTPFVVCEYRLENRNTMHVSQHTRRVASITVRENVNREFTVSFDTRVAHLCRESVSASRESVTSVGNM